MSWQPVMRGVVLEPPPPEPGLRELPAQRTYVGIFTVRDGKIAAVREYTDTQHAAHVLFGQS